MTITVEKLTQVLQGFPDNSVINLRDEDDVEFFILRFIPKGSVLNIVISDEEEQDDPEQAGE